MYIKNNGKLKYTHEIQLSIKKLQKPNKQLAIAALYFELEDLKYSKIKHKNYFMKEFCFLAPFIKNVQSFLNNESDLYWPTKQNREQRGIKNKTWVQSTGGHSCCANTV